MKFAPFCAALLHLLGRASAAQADCAKLFDAKAAMRFEACTKRAVNDAANASLSTEQLTFKILHQSCKSETAAQVKSALKQHRCFVPGEVYSRNAALERIKFNLMGTVDSLRAEIGK